MPRNKKLKLKSEEFIKKETSFSQILAPDTLIIGVDPGLLNIGICLLYHISPFYDDQKNTIFQISFHQINLPDQQDYRFKIIAQFLELLKEFLKNHYPSQIVLTFENYPFFVKSRNIFQIAEVVGSLITITRLETPLIPLKIEKITPQHGRTIVCGVKSEDEARKTIITLFKKNQIIQNLSPHEIDAFIVANAYLVDTYKTGVVKNNFYKIILTKKE
jgi:Holliday junction resolvasome RuvABC endonuclease subunit